jgi:hypothetical protein
MNSFNRNSNISFDVSKMSFRTDVSFESNGWTRVDEKKVHKPSAPYVSSNKPHAPYGGAGKPHAPYGGAGKPVNPVEDDKMQRARSKIEHETKQRLYVVNNQVKKILLNSGGDLSVIEDKLNVYYQTLTKSEEKAKLIGILVENSIHELFCPGSYFGNIIASEMSIASSLSKIKERDGYNLFTWAVWIPWNKDPIPGIDRTQDDIIASVSALMAHRVNPFRINQKHESFFDTALLCVDKKKLTIDTYNTIYQMILYNPFDIDMCNFCIKHDFIDILNPEMKFTKGLVQWGLTVNEEICDVLLTEAFNMDKNRVGGEKLLFQTTDFQYVSVFDALMQLIRATPHKNFIRFFDENPIDVDGLTNKIATFYMENIMKEYATAYQYEDKVQDGWLFKNLENLGAFIWDISQYTVFPEISDFSTKIKIGYGVRGLKKAGVNADLLREILTQDINRVEHSFVLRALETTVIPKKVEARVEDDARKTIDGFKTGLEELKSEETIIYSTKKGSYHSPGCIHDAICDISDMLKTNNSETIARSFVFAVSSMYKPHQLSNLSGHVKFLIETNLLVSASIAKVLEDEEDHILDMNDYSKSSKEVMKILRVSL